MLLKLVNTRKLAILNKTDQCRGLWTRTDEKTKSVIDYIIVDEESLPAMEEMVIDEEKEFSPKPNTADAQLSDHNVMIAKFNWILSEMSNQENKMITTKNGYSRIGQEMEKEKISEILDENMELQVL